MYTQRSRIIEIKKNTNAFNVNEPWKWEAGIALRNGEKLNRLLSCDVLKLILLLYNVIIASYK